MHIPVALPSQNRTPVPPAPVPGTPVPGTQVRGEHRALIASTTWWPFPARMAMEFRAAGFGVGAVCPKGNALLKTHAVERVFRYSALRPLHALRTCIAAYAPDIIVPCDDRVVDHLHRLYESDPNTPVAAIIARSLGDMANVPIVLDRSRFIQFARAAGVRAPDMAPISCAQDIGAMIGRIGLPAVLKTNGTWGGQGVEIVETIEAAILAWRRAACPLPASKALKRLVVDRDAYHVLPWLDRRPPACGLQSLVAGRPANCSVACWQGEVLGLTCVEALASNGPLGASTVVHVINHAAMAAAARRLVRLLGLSGFCGFDFVLDPATGAAHLLEINPRSTPLCHLALGPGREPVVALAAQLSGQVPRDRAPATDNDIIAYFPQAWQLHPSNELLRLAYHDVPWREPDLVRELIRVPRPDRGPLAALVRWLKRGVGQWRQRSRAPCAGKADATVAPRRDTVRLGAGPHGVVADA